MPDAASADVQRTFEISRGGLLDAGLRRTRLGTAIATNRPRRAVLLVLVTWLPPVLLSALDGTLWGSGVRPTFLQDPGPYARLLFAVPLLVMGGGLVDAFVRSVVRYFERSGLLTEEARSPWREALRDLERRRDARWVDPFLIALSLWVTASLALHGHHLPAPAGEASWVSRSGDVHGLTAAGWWYLVVATPVFHVCLYRWLYRYAVWVLFLRRVAGLPLATQPTHPDRAGGLGILALGPKGFVIPFVAGAAVMASAIAQDILYGEVTPASIHRVIAGYAVLTALVLVAPLSLFSPMLLRTKRRGLLAYGALAQHLSRAFSDRWLDEEHADPTGLIDSADPSALADYGADFEAVQSMRPLPVGVRSAIGLLVPVLLPFAPLLLTSGSVTDLLERLRGILL